MRRLLLTLLGKQRLYPVLVWSPVSFLDWCLPIPGQQRLLGNAGSTGGSAGTPCVSHRVVDRCYRPRGHVAA